MRGRFRGWVFGTGQGVVLLAGAGVLLFYVNRLFAELPLYAGDEGAYLIRALYARELAADPQGYPSVQPVANTLYFWLIQAVDALSLNVIPWMRLIGAAAYFGGLAVLFSIAVKEAGRKAALGALLIAAAFPYYRFVFTAMPEGIYVGLLSLLVLTLYRTYFSRPLLGAGLVGGLAAALVLVKPHGVVVAPAFLALCLVEAVIGRRAPLLVLGRLIAFAAAFMAVGCAIELADGRPLERAARFFLGGDYYAGHLGHAAAPDALAMAAISALAMVALCAVLVSTPLVAAASERLGGRKSASAAFGPGEVAFLFVTLCLAGALAMVAIFAFKVAFIEAETRRLWGRYFEFYVPMLWLLAARPLGRWEARAATRERLVAAGVIVGGLVGLLAVFSLGVRLFPWDGAAITAFASPDVVRFPFGYLGGARLLAVIATLATAAALATGLPPRRVWLAYFVALGVLSTRADDAWGGEIAARRTAIEHELHIASALTLDQAGPTVVLAQNANDGHVAYLRLNGRVAVHIGRPDKVQLEDTRFSSAIVFGDRPLGAGWRKTYAGKELSAYIRDPATP